MQALQRRRDRLVRRCASRATTLIEPEGTFYIFVRAPIEDDRRFCELLARTRCVRAAGLAVRDARMVPDLRHRQRRHGRAVAAGVRQSVRGGAGMSAYSRSSAPASSSLGPREVDRSLLDDGAMATGARAPDRGGAEGDDVFRRWSTRVSRITRGPASTRPRPALRMRDDALDPTPWRSSTAPRWSSSPAGTRPTWPRARRLPVLAAAAGRARRRLAAYAGCSAGVACLSDRDASTQRDRRHRGRRGRRARPASRRCCSGRIGTSSTRRCPGARAFVRPRLPSRVPGRHRRADGAGRRRLGWTVAGRGGGYVYRDGAWIDEYRPASRSSSPDAARRVRRRHTGSHRRVARTRGPARPDDPPPARAGDHPHPGGDLSRCVDRAPLLQPARDARRHDPVGTVHRRRSTR